MQLALDFSVSDPVQQQEDQPLLTPAPEVDLGRFASNDMAYASVRERQGVVYRGALSGPQLVQMATELRHRVELDDHTAIAETVSLLSGVPPAHVGAVGLHDSVGNPAVITVSARTGHRYTDMGRICLGQAARPPSNGTALPASHLLLTPLPAFLVQALRRALVLRPQAGCLGDLLDFVPPTPSMPIFGSTEGRLRATHARARDGLSALAISLELDNYDAALITHDFALVDKARVFYVLSYPQRIAQGCRRLYAALGWDDPVAFEVVLPFGSMVVPRDGCITAVYEHLRGRAQEALPARRYTLESLLEHHNRYAILSAWVLTFCMGARESKAFDFMARTCCPGALFIPYRDKLVGPFKHIRPALMCRIARGQVAAWWRHLQALYERLQRLEPAIDLPWTRHLRAVLDRRRVPLLFEITGHQAVPLGSSALTREVPDSIRLVANAGRHFWQTTLYRRGVSTHAIDVYARHSCRGTEPLSSTTLVPPIEVHRQVCDLQDTVLDELGIAAVSGLGRRLA
jgi:hypothetical protein